jgi:hypothetical protein
MLVWIHHRDVPPNCNGLGVQNPANALLSWLLEVTSFLKSDGRRHDYCAQIEK